MVQITTKKKKKKKNEIVSLNIRKAVHLAGVPQGLGLSNQTLHTNMVFIAGVAFAFAQPYVGKIKLKWKVICPKRKKYPVEAVIKLKTFSMACE